MDQSLGWESLQQMLYQQINYVIQDSAWRHLLPTVDIRPDFVQLKDHPTCTTTRGSKRLHQLPATNYTYKFPSYPQTINN